VRVAVTGAVMVGPTSATAPTSTSSATTGFADLGYISDAGVTESRGRSTNSIKAWQNGDEVRVVVTDGTLTYKFVLLETSLATVQAFYGAAVTSAVADGSFVVVPTATGGRKSFLIDVVDGAELIRTYIPLGEITDVGDKVYSNGEAIGYECTLTAYPSSAISGNAKVWMTALKS
jgi:hypothetical protein